MIINFKDFLLEKKKSDKKKKKSSKKKSDQNTNNYRLGNMAPYMINQQSSIIDIDLNNDKDATSDYGGDSGD
jgi:hypothetical protein